MLPVKAPKKIVPDVADPKPLNLSQASSLHLSAIMFIDKNHWAIWLNGHKITPDKPNPYITIKRVKCDMVACIWHHQTKDLVITLRPNERIQIPDG